MKTGLATVLSLSGVLVAGTAAALVNASVLRPSTPASTPNNAARTVATLNTVGAVSLPGAAPSPVTQAVYRVGEAGDVLVDTEGDVLSLVAVTPFEDWAVVSATTTGNTAEVVFQHEDHVRRFTASLISGVVSTSITSEEIAPPTTQRPSGGGSGPTTTTSSHGDDDDEHDHDHEDDHDSDDDDD